MNSSTPNLQDLGQPEIASAAVNYKNWREQFISVVLRITAVLGIPLILAGFPNAPASDRALFIGLYVILLVITVMRVPYTVRVSFFLAIIFVVGLRSILAWGPWIDSSLFFIVLITLASLMFDNHVDIYLLIVSLLVFVSVAGLQLIGDFQLASASQFTTTNLLDWVSYTADFLIPSIVILTAINLFKREFTRTIQHAQATLKTLLTDRMQLEERVRERTEVLENTTNQLRSSATVAHTIAEIQDVTMLMNSVVTLTSEQFNCHHVGLFLLDENKKIAFLQAASSETGQQMIGEGFHVEADRRNIINIAIEEKAYQIAANIGGGAYVKDANFPLTRSRIILPLNVHNTVIGVLDLHSEQPQAFNSEDAEILQTLADLVAISIDNTRLINETKALVAQLETYSTFQTRETWTKYTSRHIPAYQYTPAGIRPIFSPRQKDGDAQEDMTVPLLLQGQQIGAIRLRRKGMVEQWSERERILVEKIAEQVALALENSRLVEDAQRNARRDQLIANISGRVRETLDVESVIRTAAAEMRRVFDLKEAEINVGLPQSEAIPSRRQTGVLKLK